MKHKLPIGLAAALATNGLLAIASAGDTSSGAVVPVRLLTPHETSNFVSHFRETETGVFASYANPSNLDEPELAAIVPEEYAAFKKTLTGTFGNADARATIRLVAKTGELFDDIVGSQSQSPTNEAQMNVVQSYEAAWRLAIRIHKGATDPAVKQLIFDQWTKALQGPDLKVAAQIYALAMAWDRNLLTDDCWQILSQTKSAKVVAAFSYLVYRRGDRQDANRLVAKQKSEPDLKVTAPIQNALNWWEFDRSGKPLTDCPPSLSPSIVY